MQDVLDIARKMGEAIAQSDAFARLRAAEERIKQDESAMKASDDFNAMALKMARLEEENKPIEVADKHEFKRLQEAVLEDRVLQDHLAAQADYVDMMRQVNEAIQKALGYETTDE